MRSAEVHRNDELCPQCGNFVDELDDETGWCFECSGTSEARCLACSRPFIKDQSHRKLCPACREERWLQRHADELEMYLSYGARISFARRQIYYENRPICIACSNPIKGAADGAIFCTRTIECRRWRRRYRTLREKYGDQKKALAEVSAEIFAAQHRMGLKT